MPDGKFLTRIRNGRASYLEATPTEIGAIDSSLIDTPNGVAPLGPDSIVPMANLPPGFVSTIVEVANFAALPVTGDPAVIYKTMDNGQTWRWGGTSYVSISGGLVLGETSSTAYRGDRGADAYTKANAAEPGLGAPGVTSFLRSTAAGVRAWVVLTVTDISDFAATLASALSAYLTKNNPTFTGSLSGPTATIGGVAKLGPWSAGASVARFGHAGFDAATGFGILQAGDGSVYVDAASGGVSIRQGGVTVADFSTGFTNIIGRLQQAGSDRITAGGGFRGVDAKLVGAGSDTFGSGPGVMLSDAATGYSSACAIQMTASGGMAFWTWTGSAWRNYWSIGYLGFLRNSSWAGGGTRPVFVNNSGDFTTSGDLVTHKSATYDFTNINGGVVVHDNSDTNATLSNGRPGVCYTLWQQYVGLSIVIPTGVKLWSTGSSYTGPTTFTLGGARPIMIQCLDSANWLIPNYGE